MEKRLPDSARIELTREEVRALVNFLYSVGYISPETHPMMSELSKKLEEFCNDSEN